jgi:two-component system, sensor histidine kinase ChiS
VNSRVRLHDGMLQDYFDKPMSTKPRIKITLLTVFCLLQATISIAQSDKIGFDHFTQNNGLSNCYVNSLIQDSRGFIWIATENGLNRFDGINFRKYFFDPSDTTSLPSNSVTYMTEDKTGNIWVMTLRGLCEYDRKLDRFSRKKLIAADATLNHEFIFSGFTGKNGFLWVSATNGIFRINLNDQDLLSRSVIKAEHYNLNEEDVDRVNKNKVYRFAEDKEGRIWVTSFGKNLYYYDPVQNKFIVQTIDLPETSRFSNNLKDIMIDRDGDIYITVESVGLVIWQRDKNVFKFFHPDGSDANPRGDILYALSEDNDGLIWIGDRIESGVSIYNKNTGKFKNLRHDSSDPFSLNSDKINNIYCDNTGAIWVASILGIDKYSPGKYVFNSYVSDSNVPDKLSFNNILCFAEGEAGDIWIGTDGGGLNRFNKGTGKFSHYVHDPSIAGSLSSNAIISLCEDHEGTLWLGTFNGGLVKMKNGIFSNFMPDPLKPNSISCKDIWYVLEDSKKNLWVATLTKGLDLYDRKTNKFYNYTSRTGDSTTLINNSLVELYEDSRQNLYVTCNQGVSVMNLNDYDFSKMPPDIKFHNLRHSETRNSISNNNVCCVMEDNSGNIWFGMKGTGIDKLDRATGKFSNYSVKDGLPGNTVTAILADSEDNLWLATNNGLAKFDTKTLRVTSFDRSDGLVNNTLKGWAIKAKDGEMFFCGPEGFNSFYPASIEEYKNPHIPPVVITQLKIFNKPVKINDKIRKRTILTSDISETRELVLTYKENFFSFEFFALDFVTPEKNSYAYKMEGFDRDWINSESRREASYTNLSPGKYLFRVIASNNAGEWNREGASLRVIILPPWWKTLLFRIVAISVVLFTISYLIVSKISQLQREQKKLAKLVAEKTSELQEANTSLKNLVATKDKFFSIIAHDIKNPFIAIMGLSEILEEDYSSMPDEKRVEIIKMISTSSKNLYDLLENLLKWSRSQRGTIEFKPERTDLKEFVPGIINLLRNSAVTKGISLSFNISDPGLAIYADRQMVDTIIRNLLSNAIKFTNRGGEVKLSAEKADGFAMIKIIDNGVGIGKDHIDKIFNIDSPSTTPGTENEKGTGLGLILTKEFVSKNGGRIGVNSTIGEGSTFYFTIPLAKSPESN